MEIIFLAGAPAGRARLLPVSTIPPARDWRSPIGRRPPDPNGDVTQRRSKMAYGRRRATLATLAAERGVSRRTGPPRNDGSHSEAYLLRFKQKNDTTGTQTGH